MKYISLTQGRVASVDDDIYEQVAAYKWHAAKRGKTYYAASRLGGGRHVYMHRFIASLSGIVCEQIDHRDGDGLNNQRSNLRPANRMQNQQNRGATSMKKNGLKGVYFYKRTGKWMAGIRVNGKQLHLGFFATPEEASLAYDTAALKYHGEFATLNEVPGRATGGLQGK